MRIAVIGCGAMGTIFAGLLAKSGNDVAVILRNPATAKHIQQHGIRVEGASGSTAVSVRAYSQAPVDENFDLVILSVKATQIEAAAQSAIPLVGKNTTVLTIQNGLGSGEVVASILGGERLMIGIAGGFGAQLEGPGYTYHNNMQIVRMGPYADLDQTVAENVAAVWTKAGFTAEAVDNIAAMQWEKLICNVAYSAPTAITGMTVGQVMDDPNIGPISRAAAQEAWNVAIARGIQLSVTDPIAHVRAFASGMPHSRPSLLQDVEAGRQSEIDYINGAIPREAKKAGIEAPVNTILTGIVKAKETYNFLTQ